LQSIINCLGNTRFPRLRVGIGLPQRIEPSDFVLGRFTVDEEKEMAGILGRSVDAIIFYLKNGIELTMNKYN